MDLERLRKVAFIVARCVGEGLTADDVMRSQACHRWAYPADPITRDEVEQVLGMTLREVMELLNPPAPPEEPPCPT
jgi:hypothetical protein